MIRIFRKILGICGLGTVWYMYPREPVSHTHVSMTSNKELNDIELCKMNNIIYFIFSFLSVFSFGVVIYQYRPNFMETIQNSIYHCLYQSASAYTQCSTVCERCTVLGKTIVYKGYQHIAPYVEKIATYMEINLPYWLQSERSQEEWREINSNLIQQYPWICVYSTPTKWYKETCKELNIISNENSEGILRFILFRIIKDDDINESIDNFIIYRRFNTLTDAELWWKSCDYRYENAKDNILRDYIEEHPFIQLTPRNNNIQYDWRKTIKSFSVRNNIILDKDFIEWCIDSEEHTIDDHYPLDYIDSNINIGQIHENSHVIIGDGVKHKQKE